MEVLAVVIFVNSVVIIAIIQVKGHKRKIKERIHSIGGEVIAVEKKSFNTGPFVYDRRGRTIYKVRYMKDNEEKEGWVMFGSLSGPDWRL